LHALNLIMQNNYGHNIKKKNHEKKQSKNKPTSFGCSTEKKNMHMVLFYSCKSKYLTGRNWHHKMILTQKIQCRSAQVIKKKALKGCQQKLINKIRRFQSFVCFHWCFSTILWCFHDKKKRGKKWRVDGCVCTATVWIRNVHSWGLIWFFVVI